MSPLSAQPSLDAPYTSPPIRLLENRSRFAFVLEQTLGHLTHARNLERSLDGHPEIDATVVRLRPRGGALSRLPVLGTWSYEASRAARAALTRRLREQPIDACLIHTQVAALFVNDLMRSVPTVISLDATARAFDTLGDGYGHRPQGRLLERGKDLLNRRAFHAARAIVAWSQWAADSLMHDYGVPAGKIFIIRPGVDLTLFRPAETPRPPGPARLLFVGNDFTRKGGLELLAAMPGLQGRARLEIASNGSVPVGALPANVSLHRGVAPHSAELLALYQGADALVLPSRSECFGHVIVEAMACGLPVVSCPTGAVPELVIDGVTGLLVPCGNGDRLAQTLQTLTTRPDLRAAMGRAGRLLAEREHDMRRNHDQLFALMAQA